MSGDAGRVLDLLGSETNRRIVAIAAAEPVAADEVAAHIDASRPTAYRHLDDLVDAGLVRERVRYDDEGDHFSVYDTVVDELRVRIEAGDVVVDVVGAEERASDASAEPVPDSDVARSPDVDASGVEPGDPK